MPRTSKLTNIQVGTRFAHWTIQSPAIRSRHGYRYICRCDCGNVRLVWAAHLVSGYSRSCRCAKFAGNIKHGKKGTPEYYVWMAMRSRCRPGNSDQQRAYFDRGIRVCERWNDFRLFLADMGDRPSPDHSLDRINNDGNYEPGNCRWATATVQANNKQRTRWLTFRGETASLTEMARGYGINRNAVRARLDRGWSTERALTVPAHGRKRKRVESRAELALTRVIEQAVALDDLARDNVAEVVRAELVKGRAA